MSAGITDYRCVASRVETNKPGVITPKLQFQEAGRGSRVQGHLRLHGPSLKTAKAIF